jgi:YbgC/YbaW family acyl-CoA thioester hydrolase
MEKHPRSLYKIRFSDCDMLGHLNNARYIDYFLNAREDHLQDHYQLDLNTFYEKGMGWVVGSHEIIYKRPAVYNEKVCIASALIEILPDSLLVEMVMMDEKETHLKSLAWTRFIHINMKTGKRENIPASFMDFAGKLLNTDITINDGLKGRETALKPITKV